MLSSSLLRILLNCPLFQSIVGTAARGTDFDACMPIFFIIRRQQEMCHAKLLVYSSYLIFHKSSVLLPSFSIEAILVNAPCPWPRANTCTLSKHSHIGLYSWPTVNTWTSGYVGDVYKLSPLGHSKHYMLQLAADG